MKRKKEIISLNSVPVEQKEKMSLDERFDKLISSELKVLMGGYSVICPNKACANCLDFEPNSCLMNHYDGYSDPCSPDYCDVMNGQT